MIGNCRLIGKCLRAKLSAEQATKGTAAYNIAGLIAVFSRIQPRQLGEQEQ